MKRIDDARVDVARIVTGILPSCLSIALSGNSNSPCGFVAQSIFDGVIAVIAIKCRREKDRDLYSLRSALRLDLSSSLSSCHLVLSSRLSHSASPGNNFSSKSKAVGAAKSEGPGEREGEVQFRWLFGYVDLETTST